MTEDRKWSSRNVRDLFAGVAYLYRHKSEWEMRLVGGIETPESLGRRQAFKEVADHLDALSGQIPNQPTPGGSQS